MSRHAIFRDGKICGEEFFYEKVSEGTGSYDVCGTCST